MHAGQKMQKGSANWIIARAWDRTKLEAETMISGFGSSKTGICSVDRYAKNYRDLDISKAVTPEQAEEEQKKKASGALRARAYGEYSLFKTRAGGDVVLLRQTLLDESQRHWLKTAREIAEVKSKRQKEAHKGYPNTKQGALCTAKHFRVWIKEQDDKKAQKITDDDAKRAIRAETKLRKAVEKVTAATAKATAKTPAKISAKKIKAAAPPPQKPVKKKRRSAWSEDEYDTDDDEGHEVSPPSEDEGSDDSESEFEYESILGGPNSNGEFLVKWAGYTAANSTWEPRHNIPDEGIQEYLCAQKNSNSSDDEDDDVPIAQQLFPKD